MLTLPELSYVSFLLYPLSSMIYQNFSDKDLKSTKEYCGVQCDKKIKNFFMG